MRNIKTDRWILVAVIALLLMTYTGSCGNDENIVILKKPEVIRLLSNDSSKTWNRVSLKFNDQDPGLTDCEIFINTRYISGSKGLVYISSTEEEFCGRSAEILDSGSWEVFQESSINERIDRIGYYSASGDTTYKMINEITALLLTVENDQDVDVVTEIYQSGLPY